MQLCILKGVTAMFAHDEQATTNNLLAVVAEACGEQNPTVLQSTKVHAWYSVHELMILNQVYL
jgi:hypothetical protein